MKRVVLLAIAYGFFTIAGIAEIYQKIGPSTGLPIPRYISLNSDEAYMRRGPSQAHPVEWVYHRSRYPLMVIGESGHWRKVEDPNGVQGWFHYALLSGQRTVIILDEKIELREIASENSQIVAILQKDVIASLKACREEWCQVEIDRLVGWLPKKSIWGVDDQEIIED